METPKWMRGVLVAAAAYNLAYAGIAVAFPQRMLGLFGVPADGAAAAFWQGLGMFVGVWGIGYACAAIDPLRHWPVVLVGLLGKVFGPIGFAWAAWHGTLPATLGWTLLPNDVAWWVPFFLILRAAYCRFVSEDGACQLEQRGALLSFQTNGGESLATLSRRRPTLAVFLRHFGCTFCRETLSDLGKARGELAAAGVGIALVHNGDEAAAADRLARYGLDDLPRIADPKGVLYRAMGLRRGTLRQLLCPFVWRRGIAAGIKARHGVGKLSGDGFRLPGAFLLVEGDVAKAVRHRTAADRTDFLAFAGCAAAAGKSAEFI